MQKKGGITGAEVIRIPSTLPFLDILLVPIPSQSLKLDMMTPAMESLAYMVLVKETMAVFASQAGLGKLVLPVCFFF